MGIESGFGRGTPQRYVSASLSSREELSQNCIFLCLRGLDNVKTRFLSSLDIRPFRQPCIPTDLAADSIPAKIRQSGLDLLKLDDPSASILQGSILAKSIALCHTTYSLPPFGNSLLIKLTQFVFLSVWCDSSHAGAIPQTKRPMSESR